METMPLVQTTSNEPGYPGVPKLSQMAGLRLLGSWDTVAIYHMHIYMRDKSMHVFR